MNPVTARSINSVSGERADIRQEISPLSKEIVIGLVGYAGSGCSSVAKKLRALLSDSGYGREDIHIVKLSDLIDENSPSESRPVPKTANDDGAQKLQRAKTLQDLGDGLRERHGDHAIAAMSIKKIKNIRGTREHGKNKIAFILDSIKHSDEVDLLRRVYDKSFKLLAVHCDRSNRESRLIGDNVSDAKYGGAPWREVHAYLDRDEKDTGNSHGQQVRDAFFRADYFLDNNGGASDLKRVVPEIKRFVDLILGNSLIRPRPSESGMFLAQGAALRSSCLSRQVGAALESADGRLVSSGANEVPKFGGGVYSHDDKPDHRCFKWKWQRKGEEEFYGCHNSRLKKELRSEVSGWFSKSFSKKLALLAYPLPESGFDAAAAARNEAERRIAKFFEDTPEEFRKIPGIKDIIEYSRSIHAEMNALFNAAIQGISTKGATLYATTFPCHNCARHLVTAGVIKVFYIEPFTKSMAVELHGDSISVDANDSKDRMLVIPFTGVGPRMFDDCFGKRLELKDDVDGHYIPPKGEVPHYAVRLKELSDVEAAAVRLLEE